METDLDVRDLEWVSGWDLVIDCQQMGYSDQLGPCQLRPIRPRALLKGLENLLCKPCLNQILLCSYSIIEAGLLIESVELVVSGWQGMGGLCGCCLEQENVPPYKAHQCQLNSHQEGHRHQQAGVT